MAFPVQRSSPNPGGLERGAGRGDGRWVRPCLSWDVHPLLPSDIRAPAPWPFGLRLNDSAVLLAPSPQLAGHGPARPPRLREPTPHKGSLLFRISPTGSVSPQNPDQHTRSEPLPFCSQPPGATPPPAVSLGEVRPGRPAY